MMCGVITNQDIENPLLSKVVNPLFNGYFRLLQRIIWW
jgi:hypothetical protein